MKRDMELVRKILLTIENSPHGHAGRLKIDGYTDEQVGYHVYIMGEAALLRTADVTSMGSKSPQAIPISLTWEGHEFLDAARDEGRWNKAMEKVKSIGGEVALSVLKELLVQIMKGQLGLP